jgi:outer membrane biosynthesis protein TonB
VNAKKTPLGVYMKQVSEAVGSRWNYNVVSHRDLYPTGEARVAFKVDREGKVKSIKVTSNTSNATFAFMCQQCVQEAELAPPPPDAIDALHDEMLEIGYTFVIYPNN